MTTTSGDHFHRLQEAFEAAGPMLRKLAGQNTDYNELVGDLWMAIAGVLGQRPERVEQTQTVTVEQSGQPTTSTTWRIVHWPWCEAPVFPTRGRCEGCYAELGKVT